MMLPPEILVLSALVSSSTAHFSPVPQGSASQIQASHWSQVRFSDGKELPISHGGYQCYVGKYPTPHEWLSWDRLWDLNREQVLSSNAGDTYIQHYVEEGILRVAAESDVDRRLILAVMMQETNGNAGGECQEASRCGILRAGQRLDEERPRDSILGMLREGVEGNVDRPGLVECLRNDSLYAAIWRYHRGCDLVECSGGETRYLSDVTNRLLGWDGSGEGFEQCGEHD